MSICHVVYFLPRPDPIKERRRLLNLTYQDLSDKTGISKSTLQRYETGGIQNLPFEKILILSEALEVGPDYFTDLSKDFSGEYLPQLYPIISSERAEYLDRIEEFEKRALDKITPNLISKGFRVEKKDRGSIGDLVAKKGGETWHLDFSFLRDVSKHPVQTGWQSQQLLMRFGRLAVYDKPITKFSIVMEKRILADQLIQRFKPAHLNIDVSILILTNDGFRELNFE